MKRLTVIIAVISSLAIFSPGGVCAPAGDDDVVAAAVSGSSVRPVSNGIELVVNDGIARRFYIYSITGQMIKSVEVRENVVVELPQGFYIIKCREWSKKIIVR